MMIGTQEISTYYFGSSPVSKLYKGAALVWEAGGSGDPYLIAGNSYLNIAVVVYDDPVQNVDNNYNITSVQFGTKLQPMRRIPFNGIVDVLYTADTFRQSYRIQSDNDFFSPAQFDLSFNASGVAAVTLYETDGGLTDQPAVGQYIRIKNLGEVGDYTTIRLSYINSAEVETFHQDFQAYAVGASYNVLQFNISNTSAAIISKPQGRGLTIIP